MVSTSINNKKADAKHPHIHTVFPQLPGEKWNINRFALQLTVRRMFSLLYYLGILAYPSVFVKLILLCFCEKLSFNLAVEMVEQAIDDHCHCEAHRAVAISCNEQRHANTLLNIENRDVPCQLVHTDSFYCAGDCTTGIPFGPTSGHALLAMTWYSEAGCVDLHCCHKR